jgi:hypothetical protein
LNSKIKAFTPLLAIIAIAFVECFALSHGIDGTILVISIAVMSGIAGYQLPKLLDEIKNKNK